MSDRTSSESIRAMRLNCCAMIYGRWRKVIDKQGCGRERYGKLFRRLISSPQYELMTLEYGKRLIAAGLA